MLCTIGGVNDEFCRKIYRIEMFIGDNEDDYIVCFINQITDLGLILMAFFWFRVDAVISCLYITIFFVCMIFDSFSVCGFVFNFFLTIFF